MFMTLKDGDIERLRRGLALEETRLRTGPETAEADACKSLMGRLRRWDEREAIMERLNYSRQELRKQEADLERMAQEEMRNVGKVPPSASDGAEKG